MGDFTDNSHSGSSKSSFFGSDDDFADISDNDDEFLLGSIEKDVQQDIRMEWNSHYSSLNDCLQELKGGKTTTKTGENLVPVQVQERNSDDEEIHDKSQKKQGGNHLQPNISPTTLFIFLLTLKLEVNTVELFKFLAKYLELIIIMKLKLKRTPLIDMSNLQRRQFGMIG